MVEKSSKTFKLSDFNECAMSLDVESENLIIEKTVEFCSKKLSK